VPVVREVLDRLRGTAEPTSARLVTLARAAHLGPTLAVTTVVALLAVSVDLAAQPAVLVTAGVFTGQLTIGWGNDLVDADGDRAVGRRDKPVAAGAVSTELVVRCLLAAAALCVLLSLLAGWRSGLVHLGIGVASGHAYNLGVKATVWSWLPYALAFGSLPLVVTLAGASPGAAPVWMIGTAAALGVGAHFLNTVPDLADDAANGIRGLPQRLGLVGARIGGTLLLVVGSVVAALGPPGRPTGWALGALVVVAVLALGGLCGRGRVPFRAAMAIALVDVVLLVLPR
jgi:4-hydroxybenzoate polyprenyltransferase